MPTSQTVAAIEAAKAASTAQLLFRCARLLDERALARLRTETGLPIRPAHTRLFPHIDLEGTRPTEVARRMGISKQAVGSLIAELEQMGVVERISDPGDRRARLVRFGTSSDGAHVLLDGLRMLGCIEADLAAALGPDRWHALHALLTDLLPLMPVVLQSAGGKRSYSTEGTSA
ncbi:MAG: MarR family transcriptional regulator [Deltaproteobacteria bacterium]|nr:MarR family transcriptional regulator [Deltaproteobacteria bacterium]HCH65240.1 MarR family transcriptional regulator [Deltaproteobacteria bacterium]